MKKKMLFTLLIVLFGSACVYAGSLIKASDITFSSNKTDATNVQDAMDELFDYYKKQQFDLITDGVTNIDFELTTDNTTSYIKSKTGYLELYDGGSLLLSFYHTKEKIDLTKYNYLVFYGNINQVNTSIGSLFVSNSTLPTDNTDANVVLYTPLNTTLTYYMIDISNLSGEYYVGIGSSNRHNYIYDMWLM